MAAGNLIVPPGDSAYDKYRAVLRLDGNNAKAFAGLGRIPVRAKELFEQALKANTPNKARIYLDAIAESIRATRRCRRCANAWPTCIWIRPKRAPNKGSAVMPNARCQRARVVAEQSARRDRVEAQEDPGDSRRAAGRWLTAPRRLAPAADC